MTRRLLLLAVLMIFGWPSSLLADRVLVIGVEGEVLYSVGKGAQSLPIRPGQVFAAGTFSAGDDGIAYLTTFSGSELRLAESGTLRYLGNDWPASANQPQGGRPSDFQLLQGKLRVTIHGRSGPPRFYRIDLTRGQASVESGQCIFCTHADGTYVYVARGVTMLTNGKAKDGGAQPRIWVTGHNPIFGADPAPVASSVALHGNGSVGVLGADGVFQVRPLSAVAAGTQNCLLSGFNNDAGAGSGSHADAGGAIVSPTQ